MVLFGVWMAAGLGWVEPVPDCPDTIPEVWEILLDESKAVAADSCNSSAPRREHGRALLAVARTTEHSPYTEFRHSAFKSGWQSRVELRNDTLGRRQFAFESQGRKIVAGDMTDTAMPLLPGWLPRRAVPGGWEPVSGDFIPPSPVLQGIGAGTLRPGWNAFALHSLNPLRRGREPPWTQPWDFRHSAAGADVSFPWRASLNLAETRISRSGADSIAEYRVDVGLASPDARLELHGARVAGLQTPGYAFGLKARQPFGDSGGLEFTLRQRDAGWNTVWDPAWATGVASVDTVWGAGELAVSVRFPLATEAVKATVQGKGWQAWNPASGTRRAGMSGELSWRGKEAKLLTRTAHGQYSGENGARYHRQFSFQASVGKNPEWSARVWTAGDEGSSRQGTLLESEWGKKGLRIRPGLELTGERGAQPDITGTLWGRIVVSKGWTLVGKCEIPGDGFFITDSRFNLTLHYQGKPGH